METPAAHRGTSCRRTLRTPLPAPTPTGSCSLVCLSKGTGAKWHVDPRQIIEKESQFGGCEIGLGLVSIVSVEERVAELMRDNCFDIRVGRRLNRGSGAHLTKHPVLCPYNIPIPTNYRKPGHRIS